MALTTYERIIPALPNELAYMVLSHLLLDFTALLPGIGRCTRRTKHKYSMPELDATNEQLWWYLRVRDTCGLSPGLVQQAAATDAALCSLGCSAAPGRQERPLLGVEYRRLRAASVLGGHAVEETAFAVGTGWLVVGEAFERFLEVVPRGHWRKNIGLVRKDVAKRTVILGTRGLWPEWKHWVIESRVGPFANVREELVEQAALELERCAAILEDFVDDDDDEPFEPLH